MNVIASIARSLMYARTKPVAKATPRLTPKLPSRRWSGYTFVF